MTLKGAPGIVPAIDMPLGKAIPYIQRLKGSEDFVTGLKIGSDIIDNYGFYTAGHLLDDIENELPIILDLQKRGTDVPFMIKKQIGDAKRFGIAAYIGHPLGSGSNPDAVEPGEYGTTEAFVKYCQDAEIEPIVVLELTPPGATRFHREGAAEDLARTCKDLGVNFFVAPATRPERIAVYREIIGPEGRIISPGNGPQKTGNAEEDAKNAVRYGADDLVIGRALINSDDAVATARAIYKAIVPVHAERLKA